MVMEMMMMGMMEGMVKKEGGSNRLHAGHAGLIEYLPCGQRRCGT
jgi:hypothetical protein